MMRLVFRLVLMVILPWIALDSRIQAQEDLQVICLPQPPLRFAVYPFLERLTLRERLQPLLQRLAGELGRPVVPVMASDYSQLERLLIKRQAHLCWYSPRRSSPSLREMGLLAVCRPTLREGQAYRGVIVARRDRAAASLSDLRGCRFAYIDRQSNSGFLYPNRLFEEHGILPLEFFGEIHFAGTHDAALLGVAHGLYDAAAVTDLVLERGPLNESERSRLMVLATTTPILPDVIAVSETLDPALRKQITDFFLGLNTSLASQTALDEVLTPLGFCGFVPVDSN
ncbi:MAG TPA: phosphate/phosphite/phosphonate ABC transporter substrate-binding protein [Candidatus Ozemobacteraceae bacterium]|nr:phosphate/phosphite/phosphonate ABC transporter substrate-binding protein [Candidatus Ozemobacteraceae bacterium]